MARRWRPRTSRGERVLSHHRFTLVDNLGSLRQPTNPAYSDVDNLHMALAIMAVGDGYGADTPQVIATRDATQDWPLYPLLHRALHPTSAGFCTTAPAVNAGARAMLDEIPSDGEPACPGATPATHGFTTRNRFIRSKDQAYVGPPGCVGIRYHGLDYMLLHNLYAIATPRAPGTAIRTRIRARSCRPMAPRRAAMPALPPMRGNRVGLAGLAERLCLRSLRAWPFDVAAVRHRARVDPAAPAALNQ